MLKNVYDSMLYSIDAVQYGYEPEVVNANKILLLLLYTSTKES